MERYKPAIPEILKIVLELSDNYSQDYASHLFIMVCKLLKTEILKVNSNQIKSAMEVLITGKVDNNTAFGMLKLIY